MGVESFGGNRPSSSAEEPRLWRLIGPIDEDELYRLIGSVDVGIDVESEGIEEKIEGCRIGDRVEASSSVDKVSSPRVMSSGKVEEGSSSREASGSISVDNPAPKESLSSTRRRRKRPSLLEDLSWGKVAKVGEPIVVGTSSGVLERVEEGASKVDCPVVSGDGVEEAVGGVPSVAQRDEEVKIVDQAVLVSENAPSMPGSTVDVTEF